MAAILPTIGKPNVFGIEPHCICSFCKDGFFSLVDMAVEEVIRTCEMKLSVAAYP